MTSSTWSCLSASTTSVAGSGGYPAPSGDVEAVAVDLPITLGQFVKVAGFAVTGGDAKQLVVQGEVRLNGEVETRRGHKLSAGDVVEVAGQLARVSTRGADARGQTPWS
jgi:ribosome-associated protein